jgi:hypothetical protein
MLEDDLAVFIEGRQQPEWLLPAPGFGVGARNVNRSDHEVQRHE